MLMVQVVLSFSIWIWLSTGYGLLPSYDSRKIFSHLKFAYVIFDWSMELLRSQINSLYDFCWFPSLLCLYFYNFIRPITWVLSLLWLTLVHPLFGLASFPSNILGWCLINPNLTTKSGAILPSITSIFENMAGKNAEPDTSEPCALANWKPIPASPTFRV